MEEKEFSSFFVYCLIYCTRRKNCLENDFKINVYFSDEGEEIEKLLAFYLKNLLYKKQLNA